MDRALINYQTQSNLYRNETRSPNTISLPICDDPCNVITEFFVIDVESPHNVILGRPWLHIIRVVPFSYHQLLWYLTSTGIADIRGEQIVAQSIVAITRKKSGWVAKNARIASNQDQP